MFYAIWVTIAVLTCVVSACIAKHVNDHPDSLRWFILLIVMQALSIWPLVAKYSKNLIFDAILYDLVVVLAYYGALMWLGAAKELNPVQWVAIAVMILGVLIFKLA